MKLSINIDHIATLRNARGGKIPDPVEAALIAEEAGANGIVCHLREDRRHIRDEDVKRLRKNISTRLDLEMAATKEIIAIAKRIKPDLVTLVPEKRQELTTEGGLDVARLKNSLKKDIKNLHASGIPVSLFIDPVKSQVDAAIEISADMIEIHTGGYADAKKEKAREKFLHTIYKIAVYGCGLGLVVNAGHGLGYSNILPVAAIHEIEEVSIGHAIVVHAIKVGWGNAVKEMKSLIDRGSAGRP
ncbi:MAG: pyridoxine 5'-phosphate synthase [Bacteroidota bacterium]